MGAERVDLAAVEARLAELAGPLAEHALDVTRLIDQDLPAMVAELHVARDGQQAAEELRGIVLEDLAEILYAACDLPDGRTDLRKYGEATALLARARQLLDRAAGLSLTPDRSKAGG